MFRCDYFYVIMFVYNIYFKDKGIMFEGNEINIILCVV